MALEIIGVLVTPLNDMGKCLFGALKRQIKYLTNYNANIKKLRRQVDLLSQNQADVLISVEEAERRSYVPSKEVKNWLQNERTIQEDTRTFEEEVSANKSCLKGLCPDLIFRLKLSKKAVRMLETVNNLLLQQENFTRESIARPQSSASVEHVPTSIVGNLFSRDKALEDVMEVLGNDRIRSIAVHGMGGIGKTTLVDEINNKLEKSQLFTKVIKVVVSKEPDLNEIQADIARRLDLDLKGEPLTAIRANRLVERLKKEESVLIILDDLWEKLDVVAIGIPGGSEHIGCKIMLTTRDSHICNQMKIQKIIKLEPLTEDESRILFEAKVGKDVTSSNLKPIAEEIVRRCKGSPLAIATLGLTLTGVIEQQVWEHALTVLKNPSRSGLRDIQMQEVVKIISFSYDRLQSQEIKLCFLFCCLFPEDYNIDLLELRDYGVGEGFLTVNEKLEEASDNLFFFVKKLKDCGLLLEGDDARRCTVKMHDVVRDVAIDIASDEENGFLVNVGRSLRNSPETEHLKGYKRMSFMRNKNSVLPNPPLECPKLRSLLIKEFDDANVSNEESCFEGMKSLVILDVSMKYDRFASQQRFATLPSLRCLSNLRTLYLMGCDLSNKVSFLGGLRKLEILRLCRSKIGTLPEEIGNLSNLMCLDLTDAKLSIVAPNVISRLSNLEELYMGNDYCDWDQVGKGDEHNASFVEVTSLKRLSILRICIEVETPHNMQFDWWNNLKEFHVIIGGHDIYKRPSLSDDPSNIYSRLGISCVNPVEHWVTKLLSIPKVRHLELRMCVGMTSIDCVVGDLKYLGIWACAQIKKIFSSNQLLHGTIPQNLEELRVWDCNEVEEVFSTEELGETPPPPVNMMHLSRLKLWELPKLTSIWKGVVPIGSFQHLKTVDLRRCDSLEYLASYSSAIALESVEDIEIRHCNGMKKLIGSNREKGGATSSYSYSSKFTISPPPPAFPNLQTLKILYCTNLKSLFSFTVAQNLRQLRELVVRECQSVESIIAKEEEEEDVEHQYFLHQLQSLVLDELSTLTSIIQGNLPISFPLKEIQVDGCPNLKKFPLHKEIASSLETLVVSTEWYEGLEWEDKSLQLILKEKVHTF